MGASQSPAGATLPRAPKRSGPGLLMAHCGRGQLPPPSPAPWQGICSLPPCREWHPGVPAARGPRPVPGPAGGFLEAPTRRPLPTVDHWALLHDGMGGLYSGRGVGARDSETPAQRYAAIPLEGWGPHTRPRPTMIRGAGPDHPWDAAAEEWLQAAPEPQAGWSGDVSSLIRAPSPPRIVLHTANVLRATGILTWVRDAATIRPPGSPWRTSKLGDLCTTTPCPGWAAFSGPYSSCSPPWSSTPASAQWPPQRESRACSCASVPTSKTHGTGGRRQTPSPTWDSSCSRTGSSPLSANTACAWRRCTTGV